jgi:cytochrome c-type protein NapC
MSPLGFKSGRSRWLAWLTLPVIIAAAVGAVSVAGGSAVIAWTNTESFCISCHEMRDNVYAEYEDTVHDKNRTGVRAICADCHVPREFLPKMIRKVRATGELFGKMTGKIDTAEKFEAHRYEMAMRVWTEMKNNDSRACRHCHIEASMSSDRQTEKAQERHAQGREDGKTCIDCHFAIAHSEPEGELGPQDIKVGGK